MKFIGWFFVLLLSGCSKEPTVAIRIDCGEYNDQGMQVAINGQVVGDCPMDIMTHAGEVSINARKNLEDASFLAGQANMTLTDNAMKRIKLDIQQEYSEEYYYRKATDIAGMQNYLETQPDGKRRAEINDKIEQYYFDRAIDIDGALLYIEQLPNGMRRTEVTDKIEQYYYGQATTLVGMQSYIERFPEGKHRAEVDDKIEQLYFSRATDLAGMQFYIEQLPEGKRRIQVEDKIEKYYFDNATNISGMRVYLEKLPKGRNRTFIEDKLKKLLEKAVLFNADITMVQIPEGSFTMGCSDSDSECISWEKPSHKVIMRSFKLSKTEVTFDQYDRFAKATKRELPSDEGWGRGKRPVINVSWDDAIAYTKWLSEQSGLNFRLPSEAEWEYAARAGAVTKYSWGNDIDCSKARYDSGENGGCLDTTQSGNRKGTVEVGSYSASPFNLYDMHGNVWEWTMDCMNRKYIGAPTNGSSWAKGNCAERVERGGGWNGIGRSLRVSYRAGSSMDLKDKTTGIRLAMDAD